MPLQACYTHMTLALSSIAIIRTT
ncbi:hypothetical protein JMJ77_0003103, partial [Colletotrichum scovillei]